MNMEIEINLSDNDKIDESEYLSVIRPPILFYRQG